MVDIGDLDLIPRILFATDGAITHILEAYADESVELVTLSSSVVSNGAVVHASGVGDDERVLRRVTLLRGAESGRVFVHAESEVILDRLPEHVAADVAETDASLLQLLSRSRIGTFREEVAEWEGEDAEVAAHFDIDAAEVQVARTYQIVLGRRPVAWITESFPKGGFSSPPPRQVGDGRRRRG
jgi:chorismate-pyruvate lyase